MSPAARIAAMVLVLWLGLGGLCSCKDRSSKPKQQTAVTKVPKEAPRKGTWPYIEEMETRELAKDLTAKNFVVIFDGSGSMADTECAKGRTKSEVSKEAIVEWSESVPENAHVGLISFHRDGWTEIPLARYDRSAFLKAVQAIRPGGSTPLSVAMKRANEMLLHQGRKQLGYGEYSIVVVTDGIADKPRRLLDTVGSILTRAPIMIYTIGFCIGEKHSLNQRGRTYYRTANSPTALRKGLQEVLAEAESFDVTVFKK